MVVKVLIGVGIVVGALMALRVVGRAADAKMTRNEDQARDAVRRRVKGEDFVKCDDCGSYTARADVCECKTKEPA